MHARRAEATTGSRGSQRWVAGAHFDHVFRSIAEARLRNLSGQQVIRRRRLVLSIACSVVRQGGKNVKGELRVKEFFSGAGPISMLACLLASTYLLEVSYACLLACFYLLTRN